MNRNIEKVIIFGNEYILSERSASDVLSLTDFASKPENQNISSVVFQYSVIVASALKLNKKELPPAYKDTFIKRLFRKIYKSSKYKNYEKSLMETLDYNSKLKSEYLLENLSQSELLNLVKKIYKLEGVDLDKISKEPSEKKKLTK